jgi:hypothetical protein
MRKGNIIIDVDHVLLRVELQPSPLHVNTLTTDWKLDRWEMAQLKSERAKALLGATAFDVKRIPQQNRCQNIDSVVNTQEACLALNESGYKLIGLTMVPYQYQQVRAATFKRLGFEFDLVYAVGYEELSMSPKAVYVNAMQPVVYVGSYSHYLLDVDSNIHTAYIQASQVRSSITGDGMYLTTTFHHSFKDFVEKWLAMT